MSVKILSSTGIDITTFCQNPIQALGRAEQGLLAVFDDNTPRLYAITPERLAHLLSLELATTRGRGGVQEGHPPTASSCARSTVPGKFTLYRDWLPDEDFLRQAALWGIILQQPVTQPELESFIDYWQAEGKMFHHVQWQQKLARYLQLRRAADINPSQRDINQISVPDRTIPDGFRGE